MQKQLLKFGFENAKLKGIWHFSLPSGFTCPAAKDCLTYANRKTGKVKDGSEQDYRCYAAMDEARYPSVRKNRWHNFDLLKGKTGAEMFQTICDSLPVALKKIGGLLRVHIGGDFFNAHYFKAWLNVARVYPNITFYAYTKSLHFWEQNIKSIPSNFKLNASRGGKHDEKIEALGLKSAEVFFSEEDAAAANLEIDHDDEHAWKGLESFGLLLHGQQKAGSKASQAQKVLRQKGWTGYNHKEKEAELVA